MRSVAVLSSLERWLIGAVVFLCQLSLGAVALLSLELFTPGLVLFVAAWSLGSTVALRRWFGIAGGRSSRLAVGAVVLITTIALYARSNPMIYLHGGQDPGVYANTAGHFAREGKIHISDPLLKEFEPNSELWNYYLANTYRRALRSKAGGWMGHLVPGFYLHSIDQNISSPQFYYLNPIWLAIGQWTLGLANQGWVLVVFSVLSIWIVALLTIHLTGSALAGGLAALLLAFNPAHSHIATYPVSETLAGFFFLAALYLMTTRRYLLSLLPWTCLFFTRVTGFLTLPLILAGLCWILARRRDIRVVPFGFMLIFAYMASFYWGLTYSPVYAADIYRSKLGVSRARLQDAWMVFATLAVLWGVASVVVLRFRESLCRLSRYRSLISVCLVGVVLGGVCYYGYHLGFTERYLSHRWYGRRWGMAGHGVESLRFLSFFTLTMMLSVVGMVSFILGLILLLRTALRRSELAPLAILTLGFFFALTVKQLTTPYLYYFGRYLVSELLPLAVLCTVILTHGVSQRIRLQRLKFLPHLLIAASIGILLLPDLRARLAFTESKQFDRAMICIDQATSGKSVILIDKHNFPEIPAVTALRITFNKPTFSFRQEDYDTPEKLQELYSYFQSRGYSVFLLAEGIRWDGQEGLNRVARVPVVMRTLVDKARIPRNYVVRSQVLFLYSQGERVETPEFCQGV
jgi:hypothetical protein